MSLSVYKPNLLAFPGNRLPGFDPTHPASVSCMVSGIPVSSGLYINLLTGQSINSSALASDNTAIHPALGPTLLLSSSAHRSYIMNTGLADTTSTIITMAGFFVYTSGTPTEGTFLVASSTTTVGRYMLQINTATPAVLFVGDSNGPSLNITAGVPYFAAFCNSPSTCIGVLVNLLTGQIFTGSTGSILPNSSAAWGSRVELAGRVSLFNASANFGPQVISQTFLSKTKLLAWAADPWAFWYPRTLTDTLFDELRALAAAPPTAAYDVAGFFDTAW